MEKKNIEIIYISSNDKIFKNYIKFRENYILKDMLEDLVNTSIFSKNFFSNKFFGVFGKRVDLDYIIKKDDRIEILDNLLMSPNDRRKHNFKKN
tara:strand:- start:388 stop:669 length:282 start_codon:yes stop_codon:yes gene_type:complete